MENFTSKKFGIWFDFKIQPENEWMKFFDKLENVHPMKQITTASIIQVSVFGFMLLAFWLIGLVV